MNPWKVQLFELNYDQREHRAIEEVLASRWITMGEKTRLFEERFAGFLGEGVLATAVSSGTAALHIAMLALDLGPETVILPALTFVADLNVVRMSGATPSWPTASRRRTGTSTRRTSPARSLGPRGPLRPLRAGYLPQEALVALCGPKALPDRGRLARARAADRVAAGAGLRRCRLLQLLRNKNLSVGRRRHGSHALAQIHQRARHLRSARMTTLTLDRHPAGGPPTMSSNGLNYRIDGCGCARPGAVGKLLEGTSAGGS
jgi:hypothetical protein